MSTGSVAGILLKRNGGLLDMSIFSSITIKTYHNGSFQESRNGSSLVFATLGDGARQFVHFTSTKPFDHVELAVGGLALATNNIDVYYAYGNLAPLPVTWSYFKAHVTAASKVQLSWGTTMELNASRFEVEKSTDGRKWDNIGTIKAAGTTNEAQNYLFTDQFPSAGAAFYRLVETDIDGTQQTSNIVKVEGLAAIAVKPALVIYPNPASGSSISIVAPASAYYANIVNMEGRTLAYNLPLHENINISDLASGIYHVVLTDATGNQIESGRLIVTR